MLAHLSADLIAIVECVNRESHLKITQYESRSQRRVNNLRVVLRAPNVPRHCVRISELHLMDRNFEHRHERNSYLFGLFKQASQCNEVIPKIRPPDRGKNKQQKLVIRPDSC